MFYQWFYGNLAGFSWLVIGDKDEKKKDILENQHKHPIDKRDVLWLTTNSIHSASHNLPPAMWYSGITRTFGKWVGKCLRLVVGGPNDEPAFIFKASDQNFDFLKEEPGYNLPLLCFAWYEVGFSFLKAHQKRDEELRYYLTESHRIVSLD